LNVKLGGTERDIWASRIHLSQARVKSQFVVSTGTKNQV